MSRAEALFHQGVPLLLSLPLEVRQRLVNVAREKSPSAAIREAQRDLSLVGQPELHLLAIGKTIRWLAIIRDENQAAFEQQVKRAIPSASEATGKEEKL
jgi:hypothetical protein